jgi:hypothetical protein
MQKYVFYSLFLFSLILTSCSKETEIQSFQFSKVMVTSKQYIGTPTVKVYIDDVLMGDLVPNGYVSKVIPAANKPVTLTVKDPASGELLIDSTFLPQMNNQFTVLIDNELGIRQFYTPATSQPRPVPSDSFRIQLFHKIEYQSSRRTVTFKVFEDLSGSTSTVDLHELPIQITVPYGRISADLNIPYQLKTNGRAKKYRLKAYDAVTGEILVDILTPFKGALTPTGGQYKLVYVKVANDVAIPTRLTWDFSSANTYSPLL